VKQIADVARRELLQCGDVAHRPSHRARRRRQAFRHRGYRAVALRCDFVAERDARESGELVRARRIGGDVDVDAGRCAERAQCARHALRFELRRRAVAACIAVAPERGDGVYFEALHATRPRPKLLPAAGAAAADATAPALSRPDKRRRVARGARRRSGGVARAATEHRAPR
jgi:hypothetical protein